MKGCLIVVALLLFVAAVALAVGAVVFFVFWKKRKSQSAAQPSEVSPVASSSAPSPARDPLPETVVTPTPAFADSTVVVPIPSEQTHGSLVALSGPVAGQRFPLSTQGMWIGREAPADVIIAASSISKRHCWFGVRDGKAVISDEGSTNGTFLEGKKGERVRLHELQPGDVIVLADDVASFRFEKTATA